MEQTTTEQAAMGQATTEQPTAQPAAAPTREEIAAAAPTREEITAANPHRAAKQKRGLELNLLLKWRSCPSRRGHQPTLLTLGRDRCLLQTCWGGAHKARRPKPALRMKWRRSRGIPVMAANIFRSSVSAGTSNLVMKRSWRLRRQRG